MCLSLNNTNRNGKENRMARKNFVITLLNRKVKDAGMILEELTIQEAAGLLNMDWRKLESIMLEEEVA